MHGMIKRSQQRCRVRSGRSPATIAHCCRRNGRADLKQRLALTKRSLMQSDRGAESCRSFTSRLSEVRSVRSAAIRALRVQLRNMATPTDRGRHIVGPVTRASGPGSPKSYSADLLTNHLFIFGSFSNLWAAPTEGKPGHSSSFHQRKPPPKRGRKGSG